MIYIICLLILSLFSVLYSDKKFIKLKTLFLFLIITILSLFVGTRTESVARDYSNYFDYFELIIFNNLYLADFYRIEPGLKFIPQFFKLFIYDTSLIINLSFLLIAFISIFYKIKIITYLSESFLLSLIIYFSNLYMKQDFIAIRSGIATAFVFYSYYLYLNDKNKWKVIIYFLLAMLFHYSAIIFLPVFFFNRITINKLMVIMLSSIMISFVDISFLNIKEILYLFGRESTSYEDVDVALNKFNFRIIFTLIFTFYFYICQKKFLRYTNFESLFKLNIYSLIMFFLFSNLNMAFSLRSFELLSFVQVILLTFILKDNIKIRKHIFMGLILIYCILSYIYIMYVDQSVQEYKSWLI